MNPVLVNRLEAIRKSLMAHHEAGKGLPNEFIGNERETLISLYLRELLPPVYRFGSGAIIDLQGNQTGALDVVIELPFAPNFPMPSGNNQRLYLAESTAAVLEVKSNLSSQWDQARATISRVRALKRDIRQVHRLVLESSPSPPPGIEVGPDVPCYVIAYEGHKTLKGLQKLCEETERESRPDGVLVIESGAFVGLTGKAVGAEGLFLLIAELVGLTNAALGIAYPDLTAYVRGE